MKKKIDAEANGLRFQLEAWAPDSEALAKVLDVLGGEVPEDGPKVGAWSAALGDSWAKMMVTKAKR